MIKYATLCCLSTRGSGLIKRKQVMILLPIIKCQLSSILTKTCDFQANGGGHGGYGGAPAGGAPAPAPGGQADYSAQWIEYYR